MYTILYATDCSKNSISALNYAKNLCENLNARLIIFHIYDIPPISTSNIRSVEQIHKLAYAEQKKILEAYCQKHMDENLSKNQLKYSVAQNISVSKGIADKIKKEDIDMLVIGMKDAHSKRGFLSGNIANKLIDKNLCPILIIPAGYNYKQIKKMTYASDFESSDIIALEKLAAIAESFDAKIDIVHIPTSEEYTAMQQMEWFKELLEAQVTYKKIGFHMVLANSIEEGLRIHVKDEKADLLVMLERENKGIFARLFNKDMVKKMESLATIPILCYNSIRK
ncbi:universal stress protein [uncultured Eudoraea sp.]|uniref:universal stress protein n=1 Tax=uncultured Eudoraea sp. TaxID=1035614 RepID=UPI002609B542|nr:universal stress protein [uncultured Eudoraea sp.]